MTTPLSKRQQQVLEVIEQHLQQHGYPPSVREIGQAVGLTSPSTVHAHLASLQRLGYLRRDPTKPRAMEVSRDPSSGAQLERHPTRNIPLVGDVAAGTDVLAVENVEEVYPIPTEFTGDGELFMLRVRGESMIGAGILDGDFIIARSQQKANAGDMIVAGIPGEEATVKTYRPKGAITVLEPHNDAMKPIELPSSDVQVFGKVVTVLRRL